MSFVRKSFKKFLRNVDYLNHDFYLCKEIVERCRCRCTEILLKATSKSSPNIIYIILSRISPRYSLRRNRSFLFAKNLLKIRQIIHSSSRRKAQK